VVGYRFPRDQRRSQDGFGELLLRVVEEAGEGDRGMGRQRLLGLRQGGGCLPPASRGLVLLVAVDGADGQPRGADGAPAGGQALFPGEVGGGQLLANRLDQC
jgi:hypothetical protein